MSESPSQSFFELNLLIQRSGFFGSCFSPVVSFALVINATLNLICLRSGETVCPLSDPDFDKFLICGHLCLSWASLKILVSILIVLRVKCSNHVAFETGQEKLMCLWLALQVLNGFYELFFNGHLSASMIVITHKNFKVGLKRN